MISSTRFAGMFAASLLFAAQHIATASAASARGASYTEIEAGYGRESLSNNTSDWLNPYVELHHFFGKRHAASLGLRETRRFGISDSEAYGSLYYPLAEHWNSVLEGNVSPTHNVLPEFSLGGQLQRVLPGGWLAGAGLRHNSFALTDSRVATISLERYWGDFRAAYTLFSGKPDGGSSASAHRFQFNYYYGDRDSAGLSYTTGREVENIGLAGLRTTDVRNWTLSGRHWFARDWALSYDLSTHKQGSLYRREGFRLGLRYRF
jgi:YaiO family outer membrane protein